jgi:type II secretory pathway pseudopilin PulG
MRALPRSTAKDVFSHLLAIAMLYVGVISFIALLFQYINVKFPDALDFYYTGSLEVIRQSMASLFVVWPVYILMSWIIYKDLADRPEKSQIGIRKWLLYLTLFVTAVTIIVDLVTLINFFLNGEITTRFILKVIVVLVTAISVFGYYLWDLRHEGDSKSKLPRQAAIGTSIIILVSIGLGFIFVGSPAQQRQVRFDEQRVNDLATIQNEIINYYGQKDKLPPTIDSLTNTLTGFTVPVDPDTNAAYEYSAESKLDFQLCATFSTASDSQNINITRPVYYSTPYGQNWNHAAGRVCFDRTIDPTMYPEKTNKQ